MLEKPQIFPQKERFCWSI